MKKKKGKNRGKMEKNEPKKFGGRDLNDASPWPVIWGPGLNFGGRFCHFWKTFDLPKFLLCHDLATFAFFVVAGAVLCGFLLGGS